MAPVFCSACGRQIVEDGPCPYCRLLATARDATPQRVVSKLALGIGGGLIGAGVTVLIVGGTAAAETSAPVALVLLLTGLSVLLYGWIGGSSEDG